MKIHYYSGWFENALPEKLAELLRNDIIDRKSLAIIWGWAPDEYLNFAKDIWLDPAGIVFDEYHLIDRSISKEKAHVLLKDASVILLMGGYTTLQNAFLAEYDLANAIKESNAAVIMGFSAGAKNMGAKAVCMKSNGYVTETTGIYNGLGLDSFCYEPYFSLDNKELIRDELLPLSKEMDVYATSDGSFIRVKDGGIEAFGEGYLISGSEVRKYE